jgi:hypothetical protein
LPSTATLSCTIEDSSESSKTFPISFQNRLQDLLAEKIAHNGDLAFGAVARHTDGADAVAFSPVTQLQHLMKTPDSEWAGKTMPLYLAGPDAGQGCGLHVADLVLTLNAGQALKRIWALMQQNALAGW